MTKAESPDPSTTDLRFADLGLAEPVLEALREVGYERPTPIQAQTIPPLLAGRDLLGQAQTGTGKTAAFALPILSRIDVRQRVPQALVLAPTRELAIQVAEAFQRYSARLPDLHVLPIYGGQDYGVQLRMLARGVHVVVGTPGRIMDHMRRGSLELGNLRALVLDEADEMLRMGFIDDVEWILSQTPPTRQLALFSATLPAEVQRIARGYLDKPEEIRLETRSATAGSVRQRVWIVAGTHKLDALTRILEVEPFDGMIVFVRTRNATMELSERLRARGFDADAIHGDIPQRQRERIIADLRNGELDILVATDVAARGLDVERISHVVNFDIPYDTEAYVHRIGRTGRAGRTGDAILFAAPRERHMLRTIERATGRPIEPMELPSHEAINNVRIQRFFDRLTETLANEDLDDLVNLLARYQQEHAADPLRLAAALAQQAKGGSPLLLKPKREPQTTRSTLKEARAPRSDYPSERSPERRPAQRATLAEFESVAKPSRTSRRSPNLSDNLEVFRIEVGRSHGVEPRNILGAIANETGIEARNIGRIELFDDHSTVELPTGMPKQIFEHLKRVWVAGQQLKISRGNDPTGPAAAPARPYAKRPRMESQAPDQATRRPERDIPKGGRDDQPMAQGRRTGQPAGDDKRSRAARPTRARSGSKESPARATGGRRSTTRDGGHSPVAKKGVRRKPKD